MTRISQKLAALACAGVASFAVAGRAPAASYTLPPTLQPLLFSNLTACINNPTCLSYLKQAISVCKADAACYSALKDFLAANPAIYAALTTVPHGGGGGIDV